MPEAMMLKELQDDMRLVKRALSKMIVETINHQMENMALALELPLGEEERIAIEINREKKFLLAEELLGRKIDRGIKE